MLQLNSSIVWKKIKGINYVLYLKLYEDNIVFSVTEMVGKWNLWTVTLKESDWEITKIIID